MRKASEQMDETLKLTIACSFPGFCSLASTLQSLIYKVSIFMRWKGSLPEVMSFRVTSSLSWWRGQHPGPHMLPLLMSLSLSPDHSGGRGSVASLPLWTKSTLWVKQCRWSRRPSAGCSGLRLDWLLNRKTSVRTNPSNAWMCRDLWCQMLLSEDCRWKSSQHGRHHGRF